MEKGMNKTYNYFFVATTILILLVNTIQQLINVPILNNLFNVAKLIGPFVTLSYLIKHDLSSLTALNKDERIINLSFDDQFKVYFSFLWRFIIYAGIINAFINMMIFFAKNFAGVFWHQMTNVINTLNFSILNIEIIFTSIINSIFSLVVVYFVGKTIFETVILRVEFKNFKLEFIE